MIINGSVTGYIQKMAMMHKVNQKLKTPTGIKNPTKSDELKQLEQHVLAMRIESLKNKLKSGKKLTASEKKFLRENAPELYEKAVKIDKEREEYEKRLKRCRSKEEAQKVYLDRVQTLAAEAKAVESSNIPKGEKLAKMEEISMRTMAITDSHNSFVQSAKYHRLPDKDKDAQQDERNLTQAELAPEKESSPDKSAHEDDKQQGIDKTGSTAVEERDSETNFTAAPTPEQLKRAAEAYRRSSRR